MYWFINIVRAVATCLITNSHFSPIYKYDVIAKGGALGNSLFFLATGFCLVNCNEKFSDWYLKRLKRLFIPMILVSGFYLYEGSCLMETLFFSYVFPQNYWFICALIVLYPLYYLVVKYPFKNRKYVYAAILVLLYASIYFMLDTSKYIVETVEFYAIRFSYIFSFFLMLAGAYFRQHYAVISEKIKGKGVFLSICSLASLITYFGFIMMMGRFKILCKIQFIETLFCILTAAIIFLFIMGLENCSFFKKDSLWKRSIMFLGNCTLEIYLVQFPLIDGISRFQISYNEKFFVTVFAILICASILKLVSGRIIKAFGALEKRVCRGRLDLLEK